MKITIEKDGKKTVLEGTAEELAEYAKKTQPVTLTQLPYYPVTPWWDAPRDWQPTDKITLNGEVFTFSGNSVS